MTLDELIEKLEDARVEFDSGEVEVRISYQPSWPLRGTVAAVTVPEQDTGPHCDGHIMFIKGCHDCEAEKEEAEASGYNPNDPDNIDPDRKMLWIAVGSAPYSENPYGHKWAWGEEPY